MIPYLSQCHRTVIEPYPTVFVFAHDHTGLFDLTLGKNFRQPVIGQSAEVMNILLALAAKADHIVAGHLVPADLTGSLYNNFLDLVPQIIS